MVLQAKLIDNVFPEKVFEQLVSRCQRQHKRFLYTEDFGRYFVNDFEWLPLKNFVQPLRDMAREIFESDT